MKRLVFLLPLVLLGCGEAEPTKTPTKAAELHQPGPPVVEAQVRVVPVAGGGEAKGDGRVQAGGASCGRERWAVKVATDPAAGQIKLAPVKTTIAQLAAQPTTNPNNPDQPRDSGVESTVYTVTAELVEAKREADSDFHLVLHEGTSTMIAEIPDAPACTEPPITTSVSVLEQQIEGARNAFIQEFGEPKSYPAHGLAIHHQVTITGVGFFDVLHGQTGVAPNGVELHPVIAITDP
jgi:hypothetical protein